LSISIIKQLEQWILINTILGNYQYKQWEHHIDQLVYQLYGLTEKEIKIVEGTEL